MEGGGLGYRHLLQAVRRQQRRALRLQGLLWGGTALLVGWMLAAGAAQVSVGLARGLFWLSPLLALGLAAGLGVVLVRRQVGDEARTARLIGERIPGVSLDLLAAVELEAALKTQSGFSADLAQAFLARTDARARELSAHAVVDPRPTRLATWGLLATLAAFALVSVFTPRGFWRELGRKTVLAEGEAVVLREPITGEVELTYAYPTYTGLSQRTVEGGTGEVTAPVGTEVRLKTRADRDILRAELALKGGLTVPLIVTHDRDLAGGFVIKGSGSYAFVFRDLTGREVARGPDLAITAEADAQPKVTLLLPASELEVDPSQDLVLKYEAQDDYGLGELALVYRISGKDAARVPLWKDSARRLNGQYKWPLAPLKLAPGDRVSYFLEAKDNSRVSGGAQKGVSRTQLLRVYSATEHRREQLEKVVKLWEQLLKQLADRLEGPDRTAPPDVPKMLTQTAVDLAGVELARDLAETARLLRKERERPQSLIAGLLNVHDGYDKAVRRTVSARSLLARFGTRSPDFPQRVARAVGEEITELERDILYLESLLDRQRLDELKDLSRKLAQDRRELTSLVEQYQRSKTEALKEAVLKQAETLRRDIEQLMQRMAELSQGMRDEHVNMEALQQMAKEKSLSSDLDAAEKALREGKTEEALAKLSQLANKVDQMQQQLDRAQKGQSKSNPELTKKFQDFAQDLKSTAERQARVAQATKEIRDRYKEKMRDRLKERGGALREQLQKDVEALRKDYQAVEFRDVSNRADEVKQRVQEELENLGNALTVKDYDLAAESADRGERAAQEVTQYGEHQQRMDEYYQNPPDVQGKSRKMAQQLSEDAAKMREINKKLQQLFPPPSSMLSDADKQKLKDLQGQQRELGQKAQGLQQKMGEINQLAPVFGEEGQQRLESVGERMGEAEQRLQGRDPGRGYGEQKAALDGLEQLQQQMQQAQQGGQGGGLPLPMMANGNGDPGDGDDVSHDPIEIPDSDQFQAPKEFRKDLMDAMKQGTPEKYKDQVKRYYEELVK